MGQPQPSQSCEFCASSTQHPHSFAIKLDVTQPDQIVAAARERFGRIDLLLNNAGYGRMSWFENVSNEQILKRFKTNVFGAVFRNGHTFY
jgi:NAD(P)-dependent dehydrogenase (short-subunit alcohol dehydrogenase family)